MAEFLQQCGSWGVLATLAAYAAGVWVNRKTGKALFNPLLMGSIFVIVFLSCFGVPYADYKASAQPVSWLLMPATVSLAIPLYEKWELLEKNLAAIFASIAAGVLTSLGSVLAMAWVLRLERAHAVSFLPKSVTTAIGMDVAETLGGAAALAAARAGKRALLLERMFALGGLATLGLVTIYLPLCDGKGHQLSFGLAEELLKLSIREGWERDYPDTWLSGSTEHGRQRYKVRYNAQVFAVLAEQLLARENVKILYGTTVCQVLRSGSRLTHIIVENKDGRFAIPVRSAVDATGDADLFHQAAAPVRLYEAGNMPAAWFYETGSEGNVLHMVGTADVPTDEENPAVPDPVVGGRISGVDADEISRRQISCHGQSLAAFLKSGPLTEQHSLATLASIPQLRMTRCIRGAYEMDDTEAHKSFVDSIGMAGDWRKCGPAYEIPLRTLYTEDLVNCMAAGRIISVTDAMWDITRVIPVCAVTGQAAGLAMAMTDDVTALDVSRLQNELVKQGVLLHLQDAGLAEN